MNSVGKVVGLIVLLVLGYIALKVIVGVAFGIIGAVLGAVMPILIVGGIVYVLYMVYGRKALGGGRRTLP